MFVLPVTCSGALTVRTCSGEWSYSDVLDLTAKYFDERHINLAVDIDSGSSYSKLSLCYAVCPTRDGTFRHIGSGTSLILQSGTTQGGQSNNGCFYIPLTVTQLGFKDWLTTIQDKNLMVVGAMTDPKGDRSKSPANQPDPDQYVHIKERRDDGIIIRGAKLHMTGGVNSH